MSDYVVRKAPLFSGLDDETAADLEQSMRRVELKRGQVLFREGDQSDRMYVIAEGKIKIGRAAADGRSTTAVVGHEGVGPNSGESNSDTMPVEVDHGHRAAGRDAIPGWPGVTRSSKGRQEPQYDAAKP